MKLFIERGAVQLSGHVEHGRVVDDLVKGAIFERFDDVPTVAQVALDVVAGKELLRPRIGPTDFEHGRVKFDGGHVCGRLRRLNGGVPQSHRRVEHFSAQLKAERFDFVERVLMGVAGHNAVHGDAGDEHGGGGKSGEQGVGSLQLIRKEVDLLSHTFVIDFEASVLLLLNIF